jgi:hypothetical protein
MSTIEQEIEALEFEREGYVTFEKPDRVKAVDAEIKRLKAELKKRSGTDEEDDSSEVGPKVISEADAAEEGPQTDGEDIANARAAAHREQSLDVVDTPVVTEAEVAEQDSPEKVEERSNELAADHAEEDQSDPVEAHIVTEAEVAEEVHDAEENADEPVAPKPKPKRTTTNSKPRTTR